MRSPWAACVKAESQPGTGSHLRLDLIASCYLLKAGRVGHGLDLPGAQSCTCHNASPCPQVSQGRGSSRPGHPFLQAPVCFPGRGRGSSRGCWSRPLPCLTGRAQAHPLSAPTREPGSCLQGWGRGREAAKPACRPEGGPVQKPGARGHRGTYTPAPPGRRRLCTVLNGAPRREACASVRMHWACGPGPHFRGNGTHPRHTGAFRLGHIGAVSLRRNAGPDPPRRPLGAGSRSSRPLLPTLPCPACSLPCKPPLNMLALARIPTADACRPLTPSPRSLAAEGPRGHRPRAHILGGLEWPGGRSAGLGVPLPDRAAGAQTARGQEAGRPLAAPSPHLQNGEAAGTTSVLRW